MNNKTTGFTAVTAAATLLLTFAGPNGSGAQAESAQAPAPATIQTVPANEVVPQFVPGEVVQPLPEKAEPTRISIDENASSLRQLVASTGADAEMSAELKCLAGAIYFESRGEPLEGQLAVAQVIINRAASNQFPSSYCGVVTQRSQFSFVKNGRIPAAPTGTEAWRKAVAIAHIAHRGLWDSAADDALYFHAHYVRPSWSRTKVARTTIDSHIFYR